MAHSNAKFAVEMLDKIGSPLSAAISYVGQGEDSEAESAQIMAQLLGQAMQMSTALYNVLEIKEADDQADSTRLALAALCAPLIADFYKQRKKIPTEDDIKRITQSLEAVISFGENFSPAADHQSRLQTIHHDTVLFDKSQPSLIVLQAMVPVINAVEEFSFGQGQRKLVQDIADKLQAKATEIVRKLSSSDTLHELIILKSLAALYTDCYRQEIQRVSTMEDTTKRDELSLGPVWDAFATKVAMVEALMGFEASSEGTAQSQKSPALAEAPPVETAKPETPAQEPATPTPTETAPAAEQSAGPMGFFKKNPESAAAPAAETPVEPKPAEAPATPQPAEPAEAPAQQESAPAPAPAEAEKQEENSAPSSPMGFFKPEAKKDDSVKS